MVEADAAAARTHWPEDDLRPLIVALRAGDPAAHAELCQRFGRRVHRFVCRGLWHDEQLAEDVVVQTFVDVAGNIHRFDPQKSQFTTWLLGIARRHLHLELRRARRPGAVPSAAQMPLEALRERQGTEDVSGVVAARMDAQHQVAALRAHLTEMEMEVLVLHYVEELSVKEIAPVVRRSERAINSLLHRARRKARERLVSDDR